MISTLVAEVAQLSIAIAMVAEASESAILVSDHLRTFFVDMPLFDGLQLHNSNATHEPTCNYSGCVLITGNIYKPLLV